MAWLELLSFSFLLVFSFSVMGNNNEQMGS